MTAALLACAQSGQTGLRPVDPRRDMAAIADLVQIAFSGQLDDAGLRMVREMRLFGRAGWGGWLLGRLFLPPGAYPQGFVWVEQGRVVGNASLLPVEGRPTRWVLANVAVDPAYRRRGVARAMVTAGISLARERAGETIVLQVGSDNQAAQVLYAMLGFRPLCTRTTWTRRPARARPGRSGGPPARRRRPEEWLEQWRLAQQVYPEGLVWPYPLDAGAFRPGISAAMGMDGSRHWVWPAEGGPIQGCLSAQPRPGVAGWRVVLIVAPEAVGQAEPALLDAALETVPRGAGLTLEYPAGVAEAALGEMGFRPERALTWMALDLKAQPSALGH